MIAESQGTTSELLRAANPFYRIMPRVTKTISILFHLVIPGIFFFLENISENFSKQLRE